MRNPRLDVEEILCMAGWSRVIRANKWMILIVKEKKPQKTTNKKIPPPKNPQKILENNHFWLVGLVWVVFGLFFFFVW